MDIYIYILYMVYMYKKYICTCAARSASARFLGYFGLHKQFLTLRAGEAGHWEISQKVVKAAPVHLVFWMVVVTSSLLNEIVDRN